MPKCWIMILFIGFYWCGKFECFITIPGQKTKREVIIMESSEWIKQLAENEQYFTENVLGSDSVWPTPIVKAYYDLLAFMKAGNVYGAVLQVRDLYETILKMPVLAAMIYICGTNKQTILSDADLLEKWVGKTLSLGDWEALASGLINKKNLEKYSLTEIIVNVLNRTRKLINKRISSNYPNVANWRNEVIGHGALQFEDSSDYQEAFPGLMSNLKDYFEGNGKDFRGCNQFYEKIIFKCDGSNLQGVNGYSLSADGNLSLEVEGVSIDVGAFAQMRSFFFSTFYFKKGTVKYLDYKSGRDLIKRDTELNEYITAYRKANQNLEKKFTSKIVRRDEEQFLSMLSQPQGYIPPEYVFDQIKQFMDEKENGIILLLMERGMGKTAFANSLDSLYHDPSTSLIEDTVIRSYPLGNADLRGINDFINAINIVFTRAFDASNDFRFSGELKPEIDVCEDYPAETLANVLNAYQEIYSQEFGIYNLMLILDGIDEVTINTGRILKYLPTSELLNEGVYIICTSRPQNENTVAVTAKKYIREVTENSDLCIEIKRDSTANRTLLEKYIRQEIPDIEQEALSVLLKRSEERILYLKVQLALYKSNIQGSEEVFSNDRTALNYVYLLLNRYNGQAKALFRKTAAMICLLGPITIKDYFEYISGDELTYGFIGALNDLLPILTVRGSDYGREYILANENYNKALAEEFHDEIVLLIDNIKTTFLNEFFPDESKMDDWKAPSNYSLEQVLEQLLDPEEYRRIEMERYNKNKIFWVLTIQKITNFVSQHGFEKDLFSEEFVNDALLFLDMFIVNNRMAIGYVQTVIEEARKTALNILMIIASNHINISFTDGLAFGSFTRELYETDGYNDLIDIIFNENVKEPTIAQWKNVFFSMHFNHDPHPMDYYSDDKVLIETIARNKLIIPVVSLLTPNGSITYLSYLLYMASLDLEKEEKEIVINTIVWSYLSDDYSCNMDEAKKWLAEINESDLNILYPVDNLIRDRMKKCLGSEEIDISQKMEGLFWGFRCINADLSEVDFAAIENALTGDSIVEKESALQELKKCFDVMDNIFNEGILPLNIWSEERTQKYYSQCSEGILDEEEISGDEYAAQYQYTILDNCRYLLKYLHLTYGSLTGGVLEKWIASLDNCLEIHPDEESFSKLNGVTHTLYCSIVDYYAEDTPKKLSYLSRYVKKYNARCSLKNLFFYGYNDEVLRNIIIPTEQSISLMIDYKDAGMYQEARRLCEAIAEGNAEFENDVLDRLSQNEHPIPLAFYLNLYYYVSVSRQMGFATIVDGIQINFRRELAVLRKAVRKCNKYSNLFSIQILKNMIISFFRITGTIDNTRNKVLSEMAEIISDKMASADEETANAMNAILEEINDERANMNG